MQFTEKLILMSGLQNVGFRDFTGDGFADIDVVLSRLIDGSLSDLIIKPYISENYPSKSLFNINVFV